MNFMLNIYKDNVKWNSIERKEKPVKIFDLFRKKNDLVNYVECKDLKFDS